MFQSTSSSREERVEFSTKFPVIKAKPETVWLSFYHSMAIFFVLLPHLSFFFIVLVYSLPFPESHVEIHRRNSAATKPRMTFFSFHFYK